MRPRDGVPPSHEELATLVRAIDPRTVIGRVLRGTDLVGELIVRPRHRTLLFGLLGGFGLGLTLVGIFSMTAYAVARRTREIAVRRAFGAREGDVVRSKVPVVLGVVVGLGGAYYTTKFIEAFLFETTARDAATLTMAATLLALTACVAAWVPARRAAKVEPMVALRTD
jgi:ABC-type antimicrobial peptide transport system permease subunit